MLGLGLILTTTMDITMMGTGMDLVIIMGSITQIIQRTMLGDVVVIMDGLTIIATIVTTTVIIAMVGIIKSTSGL